MIYYIVPDSHRERVQARLGPRAQAQGLDIRVFAYSRLTGVIEFESTAFIFAGFESVSAGTREHAGHLWRSIAAVHLPTLLINHPLLAMQRYELLRELCERGMNDFGVYRLTEWRRPRRYPVFLRDEAGTLHEDTRLLESEAELDAALDRIALSGRDRGSKLIVEWHAKREPEASFRRYAAYSVNGAIVPCRPAFHEQWLVPATNHARNAGEFAVERAHLAENPHADALRRVFHMARVDFGRIDYAIVDGRIQVHGIHTDPIGAAASDGDAGANGPDPDLDRLVAAMGRLPTVLDEMRQQFLRNTPR